MQALLSFDNAPPFAAPLRFFLTGPLFAVLAGLLLLFEGPGLLVSRWAPGTLAATHLLTIGFMLQIMLGALIQVLPVVAGANLTRPLRVAGWVHAGLSLGALALAGGFLFSQPGLLVLGSALLAASLLYFLLTAGRALLGVSSSSPTIRGLKLALFSLFAVVALGCLMALALSQGWALPLPMLSDLHAAWGLAGWAGVLLAAMAYVVVPMFQLTPGYPARPSWWFPVLVVGLLLSWSVAALFDWPGLIRLCQALLALAGLAFAGLTWRLQRQRRRARADATHRYWQTGLTASIAALLMLLAAALWPVLSEQPVWPLLVGILLIAGAYPSFIIGMLYKIVPFLAWLHLQNQGQAKIAAPNMSRILAGGVMQKQWWLYLLALLSLLAAGFFPRWLARPAGLFFALANGGLGYNLYLAMRCYRRHGAEIAEKLALAV